MLTGTHLAHVIAGAVLLLALTIFLGSPAFTRDRTAGVEAIAYYWHFVFVVWLALYATIYLRAMKNALLLIADRSDAGCCDRRGAAHESGVGRMLLALAFAAIAGSAGAAARRTARSRRLPRAASPARAVATRRATP